MFTAGLWYPRNLFANPFLDQVLTAVEKLTPGKLIWLPTSYPCHKPPGDQEHIMLEALPRRPRRWDFLDLRTISRCLGMTIGITDDSISSAMDVADLPESLKKNCSRAYVDEVGHFQPFVYREYAQMIVSMLCDG